MGQERQFKKTWQPLLEGSLQTQALEAARFVAGHMSDPAYVIAVAEKAARQTLKPNLQWQAPSMSFGFAGVALFYTYVARCFPEEPWEAIAHQYLRLAAQGTQQQPFHEPALFTGISGLAAPTSLLSQDGRHYRQTLQRLNAQLYKQVTEEPWFSKDPQGVALADYDLTSGACGILAYLLTLPTPDEQTISTVHTLTEYLIWLAGSDSHSQREHWYVPPQKFTVAWQREHYPHGYVNCGMAHGIAGPLATLAKTWQMGYQLPGLRAAILALSRWLMEHIVTDEWGINWPYVFPQEYAQDRAAWKTLPLARASWCSGAPGISRALWLAGTALDEQEFCQVAIEAIEAVLRRPREVCNIDAPTLCHGYAGLLTICLRFAHETSRQLICDSIPRLVTHILATFDPTFPLGFRNIEGANVRSEGNVLVDDPGWLEGAVGSALSLFAAATSQSPDWDRYLLLS